VLVSLLAVSVLATALTQAASQAQRTALGARSSARPGAKGATKALQCNSAGVPISLRHKGIGALVATSLRRAANGGLQRSSLVALAG
jgi:hypothetical protein